jgi:hypothetical protein
MGVAKTTPIWLGGGRATSNGQSEKKEEEEEEEEVLALGVAEPPLQFFIFFVFNFFLSLKRKNQCTFYNTY